MAEHLWEEGINRYVRRCKRCGVSNNDPGPPPSKDCPEAAPEQLPGESGEDYEGRLIEWVRSRPRMHCRTCTCTQGEPDA